MEKRFVSFRVVAEREERREGSRIGTENLARPEKRCSATVNARGMGRRHGNTVFLGTPWLREFVGANYDTPG